MLGGGLHGTPNRSASRARGRLSSASGLGAIWPPEVEVVADDAGWVRTRGGSILHE